MKKIYIAFLALSSFGAKAQVNGEFENWTDMGNYDDPTNWATFNVFSNLGDSLSCLKYTPAYSGSASVMLRSFYAGFLGDTIPGFILQSIPYTSKPNSLRFAYNYHSPKADSAFVSAEFYKGATDDPNNLIGFAEVFLDRNSTWEKVQEDITWLGLGTPDTMIIYATTSQTFKSTLLLDDISVSIYASEVENVTLASPQVFLQSNGELAITQSVGSDRRKLVLYNANGKQICESSIKGNQSTGLKDLSPGIYFYSLTDASAPDKVYRGKFLKP